jgi:hypothetical protein
VSGSTARSSGRTPTSPCAGRRRRPRQRRPRPGPARPGHRNSPGVLTQPYLARLRVDRQHRLIEELCRHHGRPRPPPSCPTPWESTSALSNATSPASATPRPHHRPPRPGGGFHLDSPRLFPRSISPRRDRRPDRLSHLRRPYISATARSALTRLIEALQPRRWPHRLLPSQRSPGGVAQSGRAPPSHGGSQGFKSPHLHPHKSPGHRSRRVRPAGAVASASGSAGSKRAATTSDIAKWPGNEREA